MIGPIRFKVGSIERIHSAVPTQMGKKTEWIEGEVRTIILTPVPSEGDVRHPNYKYWYGASPAGQLILRAINKEQGEAFELGREYDLTFVSESEAKE